MRIADRNSLAGAPAALRLRIAGDAKLVASVRSGDRAAFETVYERHASELLSFCVYMLGSRQDAEDAVQATFSAAYTSLRRDDREIALRPWLFAIARNACLSILRRRRPWEELNGEPALGPDPVRELELREELREMVIGVRSLPERERAALVLTEVHGLSQHETGTVLGVRTDQVKAFVYQARSKLVSERDARETDCREIREELATARGAALLRGRLRRHVRACDDCRSYAAGVSRQRRQLAALLPIAPSLGLRYRALEQALGLSASDPGYAGSAAVGASLAGAAAEVAGGGFKALAVKIAAGIAAVGAGAGVSVSVLSTPLPAEQSASAAAPIAQVHLIASARRHVPRGLTAASLLEAEPSSEGPARSALPSSPPGRLHGAAQGAAPDPAAGTPAGVEAGPPADQPASPRPGSTTHTRAVDPNPPKTEAERKAIEAERTRSRETRVHASQERKRERELHGPPGSAKPPKTEAQREQEAAERKKAREELHHGHSRAPRTEEERRIKKEERQRRLEEHRSEKKSPPPK